MKSLSINIFKLSFLLLINLFLLSITSNVKAVDTMMVKNFIKEESLQLNVEESKTIPLELNFDESNALKAICVNDKGEESEYLLPKEIFDTTFTWASNNESIVKVDESGKITALTEGNATIKVEMTAEIDDFEYLFYDECVVTVNSAEEPEADLDENEEMENEENEEVLEDPSDTEPDTNSDTTNKFGGFSSIIDIISKIVKIIIDWALKNLPPLITDIVNVVKTSI